AFFLSILKHSKKPSEILSPANANSFIKVLFLGFAFEKSMFLVFSSIWSFFSPIYFFLIFSFFLFFLFFTFLLLLLLIFSFFFLFFFLAYIISFNKVLNCSFIYF